MLKSAIGKRGNGNYSHDKIAKASARAARKAAIAEFISNYLIEGGHTKEWLAEKGGIDPATLYRILNREVLPTESTIRALAGKVGEGLMLVAGYPGLAPSIDADKAVGLGVAEEETQLLLLQLLAAAPPDFAAYLKQFGGRVPVPTLRAMTELLKEELEKQQQQQLQPKE